MNQTQVVFMQVSHKLTAPDNPALEYYKQVYSKLPGYHMPEHFMEIPTWIATLSGYLSEEFYHKVLHVVVDVDQTVEWIHSLPASAIIMMSVMDVNRKVVHELLQRTQNKFVLGGYVDPTQFERYHRAVWLSSVKDVGHALPSMWGVDVNAPPDYALFSDVHVIPRLTLSEGCLYNCTFCTIERKVTERTWENVCGQLDSMRQLNFELVYLDDKTFGQAKNWTWLSRVAANIRAFNRKFKGFIVQTTVPMMLKHFDTWVHEYDVRYVEVGAEHVDEAYLRTMRKPYSVAQLEDLCTAVRGFNSMSEVKVGFIPNVMFALPDADYGSTLKWVKRNRDIITFVNPFILCQYGTSKGALVEEAKGSHDQDENSLEKSWLTGEEIADARAAMYEVFNLTQ